MQKCFYKQTYKIKQKESHIYIQNFTVYSRFIGHFKLFINQRKFVKLDICTH